MLYACRYYVSRYAHYAADTRLMLFRHTLSPYFACFCCDGMLFAADAAILCELRDTIAFRGAFSRVIFYYAAPPMSCRRRLKRDDSVTLVLSCHAAITPRR